MHTQTSVRMETWGWWEVCRHMRVVWRCVLDKDGELCVTMSGQLLMLWWFVDKWEFWLKVFINYAKYILYFTLTTGYRSIILHQCTRKGTGPILLDNVACSGLEPRLLDCNSATSTTKCNHTRDASVMCRPCKQLVYIIYNLKSMTLCYTTTLYSHMSGWRCEAVWRSVCIWRTSGGVPEPEMGQYLWWWMDNRRCSSSVQTARILFHQYVLLWNLLIAATWIVSCMSAAYTALLQ